MIVLLCPECYSSKVYKYEGKMAERGHDWFHCKSCEKNFPLKNTSYREERDVLE